MIRRDGAAKCIDCSTELTLSRRPLNVRSVSRHRFRSSSINCSPTARIILKFSLLSRLLCCFLTRAKNAGKNSQKPVLVPQRERERRGAPSRRDEATPAPQRIEYPPYDAPDGLNSPTLATPNDDDTARANAA